VLFTERHDPGIASLTLDFLPQVHHVGFTG